ncbi:MAG TPA: SDR family oxidoreductase [Solirubrobacteraceae bacterium]|nr:SDR family oxidoreductase [Solirubrobacteraceae bacterium]
MTLLLTGVTGFVGMELLARELRDPTRHVVALIRADDAAHATRRLHETLLSVFGSVEPYARRVTALAGDLERPALGLDHATLAALRDVDEIIHGAASVSFELTLELSRAVNVAGTQRMLDFAARLPRLRRFTYVSTAYVAGEHRGTFGEHDLDVGQRFRNPYEQSKFEAEAVVRSYADRLPVTIVRPSIVVGDRHSGWTASFNVLYWPLHALSRGAYPILPARRRAPVDVVSIDYVADAICALHALPAAAGGTFHLTASAVASNIGELLDLALTRFAQRRPPLVSPRLYRHVVHPLALRCVSARRQRFLRATETYLPYFAMRVRYDDARARAVLDPLGIQAAPLPEYFDRLVDYALQAQWGRSGVGRAEALDARPRAATPALTQNGPPKRTVRSTTERGSRSSARSRQRGPSGPAPGRTRPSRPRRGT